MSNSGDGDIWNVGFATVLIVLICITVFSPVAIRAESVAMHPIAAIMIAPTRTYPHLS